MLHIRPRKASNTPGEGRMGTSTPAMVAICSDQGPVAFTVTSARISASRPVTWSWIAAPLTTPSWSSKPVTSTWFSSSAPLCFAVAKNRIGIRIASIVASGTRTAAFSCGFSIGSMRRACCGVSCSAGMPDASHPSRKLGRYAMSSSSIATNSPSFSSNEPGAIARRIRFSSMHSTADSRSFTAYRAPLCSRP